MAAPIDPSRPGALPPVAQFLAEAALQRQAALLGTDKAAPARAPFPLGDATPPAPPAAPVPGAAPAPTPAPADKASISPQARGPLGAGFDPRGNAATATAGAAARSPLPAALAPGSPVAAPPAAAAAPLAAPVWPAEGLDAPALRMVGAMVAQLTGGSGMPQRVVAAQPWPVGLAHALEKGEAEPGQPPLQTWLVRQGTVQTPEGPRSFALTLRVPVPWMASQPAPPAAVATTPPAPLQIPFSGNAPTLQSGVFALVLQGLEPAGAAAAVRTSALLVLDFQAQLPASVYGREMLLSPGQRLDPWTQMAVLQASGHLPVDEDRERDRPLCEVAGCPYAGRSPCAQPFCLALRWVDPVVPTLPAGPAA